MGSGRPDDPAALAASCAVHWNAYLESGDLDELAAALRAGERAQAAGAEPGALPAHLAAALDLVASHAAGEDPELPFAEEYRDAWAGLMFALGTIWWDDAEDDPSVLDRVIAAAALTSEILPGEDPRQVRALGFLGLALTRRGTRDGNAGDLESALSALDDALRRTPPDTAEHGQLLDFRVIALANGLDLDGTPQRAADLAQGILDALAALGPDSPQGQSLARLGRTISLPANAETDDYSLDQLVTIARMLVAVSPPGQPRRVQGLHLLAIALHDRSAAASSAADNAEATAAAKELVATLGDDQPELRAAALSLLLTCLVQRYDQTDDALALSEAADYARSALGEPLADPQLRAQLQVDQGMVLSALYQATGNRQHLDEGIRGLETAMSSPGLDEQAARAASLLGSAYFTRFRLDGLARDLDQAVDCCRAAVAATPPERSDYPEWAGNLSQTLWFRHQQRGSLADLEEAVTYALQAAEATPAGHADRARHCQNLGSTLLSRYERGGAGQDLDAAITAFEEAADAVQPGTFASAIIMSSLGTALQGRFELQGRIADLDRSITLLRTALRALPAQSLERPISLYGLNAALHRRYVISGSAADLDDAIAAARLALAEAPEGSGDSAFARSNLSYALQSRFRLDARQPDIDEAVELLRAIDLPTVRSDVRPSVHANLAGALSLRFGALSEPSDLDDAITEIRTALGLAETSPRRVRYQANLSSLLELRGRNRDAPGDVDEAVTLLRAAIDATGAGQPERGDRVLGLARVLLSRHHRTGSVADRAEALRLAREAAHVEAASAEVRMTSARLWAELATDDGGPAEGLAGWQCAMDLLPLLAWPGISRKDSERHLSEVFGLANQAAAAAIGAGLPQLAVELLEHGRGLLWTQLADARSEFSQLAAAHPEIAGRLAEVRAALDVHLDADLGAAPPPPGAARDRVVQDRVVQDRQGGDRSQLAREWAALLDEVRSLPGFERFLRPPGFADLAAAAAEGPVVLINIADRCDALIVSPDDVRVVPLPDLTEEDLVAHLNGLYASRTLTPAAPPEFAAAREAITELLGWLWTTVVGPVAAGLGDAERVWWCPTGHLALLPLHAAMDPVTGECVADRFVSSYTPTLRALVTARAVPPAAGGDEKAVLVVAVPDAPGLVPLNVQPEINEISRRFPGRLSVLRGPQATRAATLAELPRHERVHFACHASQNLGDPSASALLLHDGPLSVLDMAGLRMPRGELAFLSACETAGGGAALPDESIHLAAALQAVGFRNVIATFWPVYDALAPFAVKDFYEGLAREGDAANSGRLLHEAVRKLRAATRAPAVWAPYAHFGP